MAYSLFDPYGACMPVLWFHGMRDRLRGNKARASARWGWLRPPNVSGKVVWIIAGHSRKSVRLGVELLRAIRAKRLDIRLVLTFEEEYPDLLAPLEKLKKTGWGYGPSDHPIAVKRVFKRFAPYGVVFAGVTPRPNLAHACEQWPHTLIVAADPPTPAKGFEHVYPATEAQAVLWDGHSQAPIVDFLTLLAEAQVDPNFKSLVNHGAERFLWWLHSDDDAYVNAFARSFRDKQPDSVLFVSGGPASMDGKEALGNTLRISQWQRTKVENGQIVYVDDRKWLPAIAAACTALHLQCMEPEVLWQAMAGGCAISCHDVTSLPKADLVQAIAEFSDVNSVHVHWQEFRDNPILARNRGDDARRLFWQERRLAAEVNEELLQRVFEW